MRQDKGLYTRDKCGSYTCGNRWTKACGIGGQTVIHAAIGRQRLIHAAQRFIHAPIGRQGFIHAAIGGQRYTCGNRYKGLYMRQ